MPHLVDQIADAFAAAIVAAETAAGSRVYRDREPELEARTELPAVVVHVDEDNPLEDQVAPVWRSEVRINVDVYVSGAEASISSAVLDLRAETYIAIMDPGAVDVGGVIRILPAGAGEILRGEGALPVAYCRTAFVVLYQHSLTDPTL